MVNGRHIAVLLVAVTIAAVFLIPVSDAVTENTGTVDVDNETFSASIGEYTDLRGYNVVEDSEEVSYFNDTSDSWEDATSTDYEMNYTAGSIQVLETGDIEDGWEVEIDYQYEATDGMTATVASLIVLFLGLLILVTLARPIMDAL